MNINELKAGLNNIVITAKVASVAEPRQIQTKFGGMTTMTEVQLQDDTGTIRLPLWGQQSEGVEEGQTVELEGAFTKEFKGNVELGLGRGGKIKAV